MSVAHRPRLIPSLLARASSISVRDSLNRDSLLKQRPDAQASGLCVSVISDSHTIRPLTAADEPILWEMLYHALFVETGSPPFPRDIVRKPSLCYYVEGWGRLGDIGMLSLHGSSTTGAAW